MSFHVVLGTSNVYHTKNLPDFLIGTSPLAALDSDLLAELQAILEDLVHPTEVVGKRVRYRADASKILKVYLDPKERSTTEYKLETFGAVYRCASFSQALCLPLLARCR